jgi:hypothetical protein
MNGFEALAVEALREVHAENEALRQENEDLLERIERLEAACFR